LDSLGREPFDTLSFGLQRMVLLARAMVKSPVILILDEPCLGLDGHHTQIILRAIDHIAEHTDTQILFVSHCASEMPACINQRLEFVADHDSYSLVCTQA
jgi:molybdate transport system ATP-binding protein